jgi:cell wall-associated NlpC family hydrolase
VTLLITAGLLVLAGPAFGKTYSDVPKTFWDRGDITWVTNQGPTTARALDDASGGRFEPGKAVTRQQFARALVTVAGLEHEQVTPVTIADMTASDPYYDDVQIALHLGLLSQFKDGFHPGQPMLSCQADAAVVRLLKVLDPSADWSMLKTLQTSKWEPNKDWKTGAPYYLPTEVAARSLGLRFNHPAKSDALEESPTDIMTRAEAAYVLYQARHLSSWAIPGLAEYDTVTLPALTDREKQVVAFALKYIGYPYVWGGEYPTKDSPYGKQAHGGFDCSGFDWWVMKIHFGYTLDERTAAGMAGAAKPRITYAKLKPGDLIFFGPKGSKSSVASIYHAALYLGNGWFIQSTGSLDGVGISSLKYDSYWKTAFAWGRRVLKKSEVTPAPSPSPSASPSPSS